MSMNELNITAKDLLIIRETIEKLQAEAEALIDKLKAASVQQGHHHNPIRSERMRRAPCINARQS